MLWGGEGGCLLVPAHLPLCAHVKAYVPLCAHVSVCVCVFSRVLPRAGKRVRSGH